MKEATIATMVKLLKGGSMLLASVIGFLYGTWTVLLTTIMVLQAFDIIIGILAAIYHKELNSAELRRGIIRKMGAWILIATSNLIDGALIGSASGVLMNAVIVAYIVQETLSIIENMSLIGVPIPKALTQYLEQVRDREDKSIIEQIIPTNNSLINNNPPEKEHHDD